MNTTLLKHELKQNRKSFLIWSSIVAGMTVMMIFLYPSVKGQMQEMAQSYANMPGFSEAFGLDKISIGDLMGFYGVEAGAIISLAGSMFAAYLGSSVLAKEEGMHTSEFLFSHPVSRTTIMFSKYVFIIIQILLFNIFCVLASVVSMELIKETYDVKLLLLFHLAQLIMHLQVGTFCYGLSAYTRKSNIGIGLGFAASLYFINLFVNITKDMEFLKYFTPFHYSEAARIFANEKLDIGLITVGLSVSLISLVIGFRRYVSKDLRV